MRSILVFLSLLVVVLEARGQDIPTGLSPSPVFGAVPFSQPMMLYEEFGTQAMPGAACVGCQPLPQPQGCKAGPLPASIDTFLKQPLWPAPMRLANVQQPNPWAGVIGSCVAPLLSSAAEGRPSGEFFAHQRWSEFMPKVWFQSATAGARVNGGWRDSLQRHHYAVGEFKLGGLYYRGGTTSGTQVRFHPNFPVQGPNTVWTFDGTMPPKLLMARYGEPVLFRHYNMLPVDGATNGGFGLHTISTHEHNGHNPAESDGFAAAFFFPGQYYDYRWPMQLAGADSINTTATDPWAGAPDGIGGVTKIRGDWRQTMSTHWFHDHMLDYTAQNVYKGNAAMMNYYSSIDRGREGFNCNYTNATNPNMCFPSGTALDWGNRDYDVNLTLADKAWDSAGQLQFNIFNLEGFLGDQVLINWSWRPYFDVRARRYRFRILNGSVSRYFKLALVNANGQRVPFHMIANDGNVMQHAVAFPNVKSQDLPTMAIAERYDIVIDFKTFLPGTKLYLVNLMEHANGAGPKGVVPLADVLSGTYKGDPVVGKVMEFRVVAQPTGAVDLSMNPADYVVGKKTMIPVVKPSAAELAAARVRTFEFGRSGTATDSTPWTIKTDGGAGLSADITRVTAAPKLGALEIWKLKNGGNGWAHPIHIHFEEGVILSRDGLAPPPWEQYARKDVYRVGADADSSGEVALAIRFREFGGTYMEHCHNTQHEDHAMLLRWDITNPGQLVYMPTPRQTWEGSFYEPSYALTSANGGGSPAP